MYPPLKIKQNRVWRVYTGGKILDRFQGKDNPADDYFPEEWLGSTTEAMNEGRDVPNEGLSSCILPRTNVQTAKEVLLKDLIRENPEDFLGKAHLIALGPDTGYLVKLLDSSVRLPIQSHPDKEFSRKHLGSNYGKTESWIVLETRKINGGDPYVLFGFKEGTREEDFFQYYKEQNVEGMISCLNKVPAKRGDVFVIPGKLPHAIGPGLFLLEVQEPSDFVFQLDKKGPCWDLSPTQVHMGLGDELMFQSFDFSAGDVLKKHHQFINVDDDTEGIISLLPERIADFFQAARINVKKSISRLVSSFSLGVCIEGEGRIKGAGGSISLARGENYCIPACNKKVEYEKTGGSFTLLETYPPNV